VDVGGNPPSAVVAEDQPLLRDGIASLLAAGGFHVVGTCGDADALVEMVGELEPDVAVVDIRMPPTFTDDGLRAAAEIRRAHGGTSVLVLSQHVEPEQAAQLVGDDASGFGYLLKERVRDGEAFLDAVRRVAEGGTAFDPQVVAALVTGKRYATDALGEREVRVLGLVAEGLSNAAIAERLGVSTRVVERDISAIFETLRLPPDEAHNRRVLAVLAFLGVQRPR
jgi:DNA-binding NarL/FixJ family response regulator